MVWGPPGPLIGGYMYKSPLTQKLRDYERRVVSEDGIHYRHERQEMDPVIAHVKYLGEKVNKAPKAGNRNDWHYGGTIPISILTDWCDKVGIGIDAFARNQFGERKTFLKYLETYFPVFLAPKKKSSQILMPGQSHGD